MQGCTVTGEVQPHSRPARCAAGVFARCCALYRLIHATCQHSMLEELLAKHDVIYVHVNILSEAPEALVV